MKIILIVLAIMLLLIIIVINCKNIRYIIESNECQYFRYHSKRDICRLTLGIIIYSNIIGAMILALFLHLK